MGSDLLLVRVVAAHGPGAQAWWESYCHQLERVAQEASRGYTPDRLGIVPAGARSVLSMTSAAVGAGA